MMAAGLARVDPHAAAFIEAAGITDDTQKTALNTLVVSGKIHGWLSKCFAIYPFIGGTAASCLVNLKSPGTFNITWHGSPSFSSANGVVFNNIDSFGDTGLTPSGTLSQNSAHISLYRTNTADFGASASGIDSNGGTEPYIELYFDSTEASTRVFLAINSTVDDGGAGIVSTRQGYFCLSRNSSSNLTFFKDGSQVTSITRTSTGLNTRNIYIGAMNNVGAGSSFDDVNCKFATIGSDIPAAMAASMYTDIQTFQTTLGRQN